MISIRWLRLRSLLSEQVLKKAAAGKNYVYLMVALLSGAILPIQASINAQLARTVDSIALATNISYLVGVISLIGLLIIAPFEHPDWKSLGKVPLWGFIGGIVGIWYIASSTHFTGILGPTLTLGFVVCGQAFTGIVTDHFGWLGIPRRRLTHNRRLAMGLLIAAMLILAQPS